MIVILCERFEILPQKVDIFCPLKIDFYCGRTTRKSKYIGIPKEAEMGVNIDARMPRA